MIRKTDRPDDDFAEEIRAHLELEAAALALVCLVASAFPAQKVGRLDPLEVLRNE